LRPHYDETAVGTTSTGFKKLPVQGTGLPVGIQVVLNGQKVTLQIANNTSQAAVLNQARVRFGENGEFAPNQRLPWVPNKVFQLHPASTVSALIITQNTKNDLAGDKILVNLTLVLRDNQYCEKDVMIPIAPAARDIVNAWWRTIAEFCRALTGIRGLRDL
jgi:hypothetical protein